MLVQMLLETLLEMLLGWGVPLVECLVRLLP